MKIDVKIKGDFALSKSEMDRLVRQTAEEVAATARREYCAAHGQHARARVVQRFSNMEIEIEGCCDELVERAQRRIAN